MTTEPSGGYIPWRYAWEEWEDSCLLEPLGHEETALLIILKALGEQYNPVPLPPLWDHEEFSYNPKSPEDIASFHYCLINNNQFVFCRNDAECLCDKKQPFYNLRNTVCITQKMIQEGTMGPPSKEAERELLIQRRVVSHLAKELKSNCDKIFARSMPFSIEAPMLKSLCDAINLVFKNKESLDEKSSKEDLDFQDVVMFLSDFCQQTPTLCITHPHSNSKQKPHHSSSLIADADTKTKSDHRRTGRVGLGSASSLSVESSSSPSTLALPSTSREKKAGAVAGGSGKKRTGEPTTVNLSLFKSLQFLELKNIPLHKLTGMGTLRMNLQHIKCSKNLKSIGQILTIAGSTNVIQIWPELRELDLSSNNIPMVPEEEIGVLELCPSLEVLNLSRNRISSFGDSFSRCLNSLSTLNLSYNQLTRIPNIPPSVKALFLSHNLITNLTPPNFKASLADPFNTYCPLKNLQVLDLSTNLISNESDLLPLKEMNSLAKLNLSGNPICFADGYRRTLGGYLSRFVISRKFELDRKNFSSSEVRTAIADCKEGKFIPYIPASSLVISQANSAMSASLSSGASMSTSSMQRSAISNVSNLKSMSQSFDSTSSSIRSLRRKKPKIREILNLDFSEDRENSYSERASSSIRSGSSSESKQEEVQQKTNATRNALKNLRAKYGPEHWLLRQAGTEVEKLLKIPDRPISYDMFSRSFPQNSKEFGYSSSPSFNSKSPPTSSCYYERAMANERYTNEELLLINSRKGKTTLEEKTPLASPPSTSSTSTPKTTVPDDDSAGDFFSCFSDSGNPKEEFSIFDLSKDEPVDEVFVEDGKEFKSFTIFQNGEAFKLVVYDGYLMELSPSDNIVINKWDLNCLFALEEEKFSSDTDTVQFRLKFDTMRKLMRERSFIMNNKDFSAFDKLVSPYIEERTLQEFTEALQCTKCGAQFSRGMACRTVKHEKGKAPREVRICPDPQCQNDILVTLDNIPLPNNECLDLELEEEAFRRPLKASTPVSARQTQVASLSQSIPKGKSPRVFDFMRLFPSSLTARKSLTNENPINKKSCFEEHPGVPFVRDANSVTPTSSDGGTATNTKSESDIEVLSTDSSSIEVLGKHCPDSGSEVDVEEAVEIPVIDTSSFRNKDKMVVMSESTSSSSCADSIVTTYEKNLLPISQPLSSPSRMPTTSRGSSLCTNASFISTSTLTTTNSSNSPVHYTCMPVRYDYTNFGKIDHRLQLWSDVSVLKSDEDLVALTKCMVISDTGSKGSYLGIIIFSTKKIYFYRIIGNEGDHPQEWLQKVNAFDLSKFTKLDVLIGRHGVGVDFSGKYFALVFRDSERTSGFLEFFMSHICGQLKTPPMVRDFSQTQKMMLSPVNPIAYFGIMRFAVCDSADNAYSTSAILLTNEEILLISDLGWMAGRCDKVTATHGRQLAHLRQVERLESDGTFTRLVFGLEEDTLVNWELIFETENERLRFEECLKSDLNRTDVNFICLSQPLES